MAAAMSPARIALALVAPLAALVLAACGSRAAVATTDVTTPPARSAATAATSPSDGTPAASPSATESARAAATPPPGAAQAQATAAPLATGSARAGSVPESPSQLPPRTNRSGFVVALDPGHGGNESGAAAYGVVERDSNLDMAQRVAEYLKAAGVQVYLTRVDAGRAVGAVPGTSGNQTGRNDLQARTVGANRVGADIFVSLHSNGSGDTSLRGFEVYYESRRPFATENYRLAKELLDGALRGAAAAGHPSPNRGIIDAACWRNFNGRCVGLFVLSPGGGVMTQNGAPVGVKEATNMPAALLESLFISNAEDAALLADPAVRTSIAKGIADGILRYLGVPA